MSVSPTYLEDLRDRYPPFRPVPAEVIRFGASRGDLQAAAALPPPAYAFPRDAGQLHLLYTGASGPILPEAATALFGALRRYRELHPERARRLRLHFIGTSYVAADRGTPTVLPFAVRCGVADLVSEVPHRIGLLAALRLQLDTDALLLLGSRQLAYSPSKIYPYYLARRPMLALVFQNSVMARLLKELAAAWVVTLDAPGGNTEADRGIHAFFDGLCAGLAQDLMPPRRDHEFEACYLAEELTRQQCRLFERALTLPPG
jgi:hypothetical protein